MVFPPRAFTIVLAIFSSSGVVYVIPYSVFFIVFIAPVIEANDFSGCIDKVPAPEIFALWRSLSGLEPLK